MNAILFLYFVIFCLQMLPAAHSQINSLSKWRGDKIFKRLCRVSGVSNESWNYSPPHIYLLCKYVFIKIVLLCTCWKLRLVKVVVRKFEAVKINLNCYVFGVMCKCIKTLYICMYLCTCIGYSKIFGALLSLKSLMEILVLSICAYMPRYGSFEFKNALGES